MSTRSKYLFVTLQEFAEWLRETIAVLDARVVLFRGPQVPMEYWDGSDATLPRATRIYLTTDSPELGSIRSDDLVPGRLGWLQLDVPRSEDDCLFAIQVAAKSDWFDAAASRVMENPKSLRLFDRFWRRWREHFRFPVWARNVKMSGERPYRDIGYSTGADEWTRRGGLLRQHGVANIEFFLPGSKS